MIFINSLNFFKQTYKAHKWVFWIIVFGFVYGTVIGFFLPASLKHSFFKSAMEKFSEFNNTNDTLLAKDIFVNNVFANFLDLAFGIFILAPFLFTFLNGIILGVMGDMGLRMKLVTENVELTFFLLVIPHAILELPANFVSAYLATLIGLKVFFTKLVMPKMSRKKFVFEVGKFFVLIIIPILFVAAIIESFITPKIASFAQKNNQVIESQDLKAKLLVENDLAKIDPLLKTSTNLATRSSKIVNSIGLVIFNDEIWPKIARISRFDQASVQFSDNRGKILINIYKHDGKDIDSMTEALLQSYYEISKDQGEFASRFEEGYVSSDKDGKKYFYHVEKNGDYLLIYSSENLDFWMFAKIIETQNKKLSK